MRDATLVTTPGQLEAAVFRLQGASRLAIDTELAYRARLGVVGGARVASPSSEPLRFAT
mgnify:CR=1 FL=1